MIDDIHFSDNNDGNDFTLLTALLPTFGSTGVATPLNEIVRKLSSLTSSSAKERRVVAVLEKLNSSRESAKSTENEIIGIMRRMEGAIAGGANGEASIDTTSKTRELVEDLKRSRTLIQQCEDDLKQLKKKKRKLNTDKEKNKKKIDAIMKKISAQKKELKTMELMRLNQARSLDKLNGKDTNADSGSSSDSDSDSSNNGNSSDDK